MRKTHETETALQMTGHMSKKYTFVVVSHLDFRVVYYQNTASWKVINKVDIYGKSF